MLSRVSFWRVVQGGGRGRGSASVSASGGRRNVHHGGGGGEDAGHGGHEAAAPYTGPNGYLFNRVPGKKYPREGWEIPYFIGVAGTVIIAYIAYFYKPDTRPTTKALRQIEERGIPMPRYISEFERLVQLQEEDQKKTSNHDAHNGSKH